MEITKFLYNKISEKSIRKCVALGITANQITIANHIITLFFGCYFFSLGTYSGGIAGLAVMGLNVFLDYLDGGIAKATGKVSSFGEWIDSGFDVVIQNAIMAAIALGCFKSGLPIIWILLFFVSNSGNNLVSFHYNSDFGFSSASGNKLFRHCMDKKKTTINRILKNMIDPTSSAVGLAFFTFRYWILFGIVLNVMPAFFIAMTIISNVKWFFMFIIYALHRKHYKNFHIMKALSILDEEREEHYALRGCK
jgi:phosphatidylglycerophosphate synthase